MAAANTKKGATTTMPTPASTTSTTRLTTSCHCLSVGSVDVEERLVDDGGQLDPLGGDPGDTHREMDVMAGGGELLDGDGAVDRG